MTATQQLAQLITETKADSLPDWVFHESKRTLVNILAIGISASNAAPVRALNDWAKAEGASARATVMASGLRTSPTTAALVNGYMAHLQDYDDTHFPSVLHPTAPVWPAVFALAEDIGASGRDALAAFAIGAEVACRIAMSVHPWHYDAGWHITGTAGVFGAVAGAGWLLGLSVDQLANAFGAGGTQAGGVREVFGSDSKAMHPAKAASNGLQAAMLAKAGFTGPDDIIGGRRGFWAVLSGAGHDEAQLLGEWGERWELANNGLKPYANGVVSHPLQDAVIKLRNEHNLKPENVTAINAKVHPLVLELMNRADPRRGLEGKFSFQHCCAAALVDGAGHDAQFTDAKVVDPVISAVRAKVAAEIDQSMTEDSVRLAITLTDGSTVETYVEHATGSPENPMSDEALETKYSALAGEIIGEAQANELLSAVYGLDWAKDVSQVAKLFVKG
ncbi:MAG: MmgE/PrpD family protein [Chloroflexi bacterium]|nr:MmgE/PrpD family protein [Chloroflexota bacterium]